MPPVWTIYLLAAIPVNTVFPVNALPAFSGRIWAGMALAFFLAGAGYIFNQVFDIESDRVNDKLFFLPRRMLSVRSAVVQYALFTTIAVGGGWFLGPVWLICLCAALLAVLYSLPLVRLKDRPFAGLLANAVGHGTLVYYFGRMIVEPGSLPAGGESAAYALAVAGVYLLTTVPDRAGDEAAGKRTMSVTQGPRKTVAIAAVCVLGAAVAAAIYQQWPLAISAAISFPLFLMAVFSARFCGSAIRMALLALSFFACLAFWPYFLILVLLYVSTRWYYRRRFGIAYPRMTAGG
ncbi:UbiA family prenyltransferase [Candidatus Zixiibacteriota bacterium]